MRPGVGGGWRLIFWRGPDENMRRASKKPPIEYTENRSPAINIEVSHNTDVQDRKEQKGYVG